MIKKMIEEIEELLDRNSGKVDDLLNVIDQTIHIYTILAKDTNFEQPYILMYKTLAFHLLQLKTQLQVKRDEYNSKK